AAGGIAGKQSFGHRAPERATTDDDRVEFARMTGDVNICAVERLPQAVAEKPTHVVKSEGSEFSSHRHVTSHREVDIRPEFPEMNGTLIDRGITRPVTNSEELK